MPSCRVTLRALIDNALTPHLYIIPSLVANTRTHDIV